MYMVIKCAARKTGAGYVPLPNEPIVGFEVMATAPTHVTTTNECVYINLDTLTPAILEYYGVTSVDGYLQKVINNLGLVKLIGSASGKRVIQHTQLSWPSVPHLDRKIAADEWKTLVSQAWHRLANVVNMFQL